MKKLKIKINVDNNKILLFVDNKNFKKVLKKYVYTYSIPHNRYLLKSPILRDISFYDMKLRVDKNYTLGIEIVSVNYIGSAFEKLKTIIENVLTLEKMEQGGNINVLNLP